MRIWPLVLKLRLWLPEMAWLTVMSPLRLWARSEVGSTRSVKKPSPMVMSPVPRVADPTVICWKPEKRASVALSITN